MEKRKKPCLEKILLLDFGGKWDEKSYQTITETSLRVETLLKMRA